ncbi:MAG: type II toxin-antitoxin system HigB family toxin [Gammaproteobacteria bacterium]|nr:type II toxin-antitoxin system HigB family toxin [Gammaproteobacteria bacterium]
MRVISLKHIREAGKKFPESQSALLAWHQIIKHSHFSNFDDLRKTFNSVDKVGRCCVFNIGGNKLRLIAAIHFNTGIVYIREILTHKEYDRGKWKPPCEE